MTDEHEWLPDITGEQEIGTVSGSESSLPAVYTEEHQVVPPTLILEEEAAALAERDRVDSTRARRAKARDNRLGAESGRRPAVARPKRPPANADGFEGTSRVAQSDIITDERPAHRPRRSSENTRLYVAIAVALVAVALALWLGLALLDG